MGQVQASYRATAGYHHGDLRQDSLYNVILAYWHETATRQKGNYSPLCGVVTRV
jgi:hypothetical protein